MAELPFAFVCQNQFTKPVLKMNYHLCLLILVSFCSGWSVGSSDNSEVTYDVLYTRAVRAYEQERWHECKQVMVNAMEDYEFYRENLVECRKLCNDGHSVEKDTEGQLELMFFHMSMHRSDCLRRCKEKKMPGRPDSPMSQEIESRFKDQMPYDYIQICAYKSEDFELASSAAYTFLLTHPKHESMIKNVEYYRTLPQVKPEYFIDLQSERKQHLRLHAEAATLYSRERYFEMLSVMEKALSEYYIEYSRCSLLCEGPYDHESLPDLYNAIADHWLSVLTCRTDCTDDLEKAGGEVREDYLPEHYNYLQFAYYKAGNVDKAAECAVSFLLFNPDDEVMKKNLQFYLNTLDSKAEDIKPRQEAEAHVNQLNLLEKMELFSRSSYMFAESDQDANQRAPEVDTKDEEEKNTEGNPHPLNSSLFGARDDQFQERFSQYNQDHGIEVTSEGEELQGHHRVLADGLLTEDECQMLIHLADQGAVQGDGYRLKKDHGSPYTSHETFVGLQVDKAAQLVKEGTVKKGEVELLLSASERSRHWTELYYHLTKPLYFHYTHLVCREAIPDDEDRDVDPSHPVHADNCHIQDDGSCLKAKPAYTQRDISALVYLNSDFEGGQFFFAHRNKTIQQEVAPKCGRMVGFEASEYHGVTAVTSGKRCALALWYTLDPREQELRHTNARMTMDKMTKQKRSAASPELQTYLDDHGYTVSMTETELNGPERFAAESIATEEECQKLIKLTNEAGKLGDGYQLRNGQQSPHTRHERFVGVTVSKAAEDVGVTGDGYTSPDHSSPHTEHEQFEGLTVLRTAQMASRQEVDVSAAQLYLDTSSRSLDMVKRYFNLDKPLYFDFTHLVCRTALDDSKTERTDLSHPIHSDNCIIQPDNTCKKEPPAYTSRDYSAVMYLNQDFQGGEFFFTHQNMSMQSSFKPSCGRLVGFNSSNYHGVKPVLSGQRCALALWFTLDARHQEAAHSIAQGILDKVQKTRHGSTGNPHHIQEEL